MLCKLSIFPHVIRLFLTFRVTTEPKCPEMALPTAAFATLKLHKVENVSKKKHC